MAFAHEKLAVYQKSLEQFASLQVRLASWDKKHAFVDHLGRAMESVLFNLAEAVRLRGGARKQLTLDYAVGSACECAACLDIAGIKGLLDAGEGSVHKDHLLEICRMLIGLRNSWVRPKVAETKVCYSPDERAQGKTGAFHHEALDMYRLMCECYRWLASTVPGRRLKTRLDRTADALASCILLNIAEGNGRYAELSRRTFLDAANTATVKLAVCLDMGRRRAAWSPDEVEQAKSILLRVAQMTVRKEYEDKLA